MKRLTIFKSPKLTEKELRVLDAVQRIHKSVKGRLAIPPRWQGWIHRFLLANAIRGSNSIEGYLVSKEDALAAVEGEEPAEAQQKAWVEVMGYRDAMTYVLQLAKDRKLEFNHGFLRSLHYMMLRHDLSKNPGNWRPGTIFVRDDSTGTTVYEGPDIDWIQTLCGQLSHYLRGREDNDHIAVKAAMAHLNLVMIHPFSDGNGRMGRCLQTLVFASRGVVSPAFCSIEEYLGRNRQAYYDVLAQVGQGVWNPKNDTRPWIRFNITAHYRQAVVVIRRMKWTVVLWNELEAQLKTKGLPERSLAAVAEAALGYAMRSAHYRKSADVSMVVASRDLNALTKAGFLVSKGEKRGRVYRGSPELRDFYKKIKGNDPGVPDPFQIDDLEAAIASVLSQL